MAGLQRGLEALGHNVLEAHPQGRYDLICMFQQVAHTTEYVYPDFPTDKCPICLIDASEFGYFRRLPGVVCNYSHAFAEGSIHHDTKNHHQQSKLRQFLEGRSFVYFLREHSQYIDYPKAYVPIDYPLYALSVCDQRPNREEYLSRSVPFWQSWGASHPWRWGITHALRAAGHTCLVLEEDGHPRLPQHDVYFPRMMGARACCSFDGYGSGSFRRTEVLVRTLLLDGPLTIRTYAPLEDGVSVLKYDVFSDAETFLGTNIVERLQEALDDPERAFSIYQAGYDHCMTYYTERAYAEYVLREVEAHDYSQVTPLDVACPND